jgi:hypothetical protein
MEDLQLPDNPRLEPLRPVLRALRLNPDGLLLVVCPRDRELADEVIDSARVVVWADPRDRMPASVVAVVFVGLPGGRATTHVHEQARRLGAQVYQQTITPRTVLDLCTEAGLLTTSHNSDTTRHDTTQHADTPCTTPDTHRAADSCTTTRSESESVP